MALRAIVRFMWAGRDSEGVVEHGSLPTVRVVAGFATSRISGRQVIRRSRGMVSGQMALNAIRGDAGVVKSRSLPRRRVVARFAVGREVAGNMVRIVGGLIVGQVTRGTGM